uniref:Uncharacterized protein n=1 Tax=Cacopsylla melanoneura TaxID=428564 RepID=A0A8D8LAR6_9HEMI
MLVLKSTQDTLLNSPPNIAPGSTQKYVPPSRAQTNWRHLVSKAKQASKTPTKNDQEVPTKGLNSNEVFPDTTDNSSPVKQDSSIAQNMEDNNILDPILDFVSNLFSTKPSDLPKPTPLDFQNSIRDPELAEENGLKTKFPLEEEEGNVDKNTPVKNDLLPDVGQPDNDSSRSGDQTVPKIQQQPPKEIGSGVQDKKQEDGNTIISEDEDNTKTPENKEIKQEKSEVKEELPQNEKSSKTYSSFGISTNLFLFSSLHLRESTYTMYPGLFGWGGLEPHGAPS